MPEALPADRAALVAELRRLESEIESCVAPLSQEQFDWRPGPTRWSAGQIVDHLARANATYIGPLESAIEGARRRDAGRPATPLRPKPFGRWFIGTLEPPPRWKLPAPTKIVPAPLTPLESTRTAFRKSQAAVVALVENSVTLNLNRVRFRNPFIAGLPLFNVATGFLVIAAHQRRHLLQLQKLLAAAPFMATALE